MLTEDEARKKLCPMARDNAVWAGTFTCIASDCMAWRWARRACAGGLAGYCGAFGRPGDAP